MPRTKGKQTTKAKPETQKEQAAKPSVSKMEAVRQAMAEHGLDVMPSQILEFVKTKFGVTMSPSMVSNYKSTLSKKMAAKSAVLRRPRVARAATAANGSTSPSTISMEDLTELRRLVDRLGADRIKELTRILGD